MTFYPTFQPYKDPNRIADRRRRAGDERLKADATGLVHDVKDRARSFAEEQKNRGAERLDGLADTAQRAADGIQDEAPEAARYIRQAADGVHRFSSDIRDRSLEDMVSEASDFARRQPLLVIGGAVLAGLALSRFLRSSSGCATEHIGIERQSGRRRWRSVNVSAPSPA